MTIQQMYKECEKLYTQVDWSNKASIHRYNEAVRELRKMREAEEEGGREEIEQKMKRIRDNYAAFRISLWEAAREVAGMVESGCLESLEADKLIRKIAMTKRRG